MIQNCPTKRKFFFVVFFFKNDPNNTSSTEILFAVPSTQIPENMHAREQVYLDKQRNMY